MKPINPELLGKQATLCLDAVPGGHQRGTFLILHS
jgi:hypothetical protein